jgi:hypothetical protein
MNTSGILEPDNIYTREAPEHNIETLPKEQQITLIKILKTDDIKSISDIKVWEDDHQTCVSAKINGVEVPFWWSGPELVGHLMYSGVTPLAKKKVFDWLQERIEMAADDNEALYDLLQNRKKFAQNAEIKKNVGSEVSSHFNDIIDNIL